MAFRHANGRDWWIVLLESKEDPYYFRVDQQWHSFLLKPDTLLDMGIQGVLISPQSANEVAMEKLGNRFALTTAESLLLFPFNRCSGEIGNPDTVASGFIDLTACSFSPDGNKLYAANRKRSLYVFDLAVPGYPMDTVFQGAGIFGYETMNLELGPDDRLYWGFEVNTGLGAVDPTRYLMRVENPDADFADLVFDTFAVYLNGFRNRTNAFPNFPNYELGALEGSPCDTLSGSGTSAVGTPSPEGPWSVTPTVSATGYTIRGPRPLRWEAWTLAGRLVDRGDGAEVDAAAWAPGFYLLRVGDGRREGRLKVLRAAP
jgi:hypothetical protein